MNTENPFKDKSYSFALKIISRYKFLTLDEKKYVLSKQLLRCGTLIGANGAISNADFSAKISISYKESLETEYWLSLLKGTGYISQEKFTPLY